MKQFSVYIKPVGDLGRAKNLARMISLAVPPDGEVSFLYITEKQYLQTDNYIGQRLAENEEVQRRKTEHLTLFE